MRYAVGLVDSPIFKHASARPSQPPATDRQLAAAELFVNNATRRMRFFGVELEEGMGGVEEPGCVEMEAAEQLIQLSGGDDDGESASCKSADSVKAGGPKPLPRQGDDDKANMERAPAVEVESSSSSRPRRPEKSGPEKGGGGIVDGGVNEEEAVIGGGERRRRPRFRSLAAIYRETRRAGGVRYCPREEAAAHEDGKRRNNGKRRPAAGGMAGEAIPAVAACKARRLVSRPKD